jgi:hypothetical protein
VIVVAIATLGVALFERVRLPAIGGFLVMGALLGPGGLGVVGDAEEIRTLAELGVVFLLFEIGLELPLGALRRFGRATIVAGAAQVGLTIAVVARSRRSRRSHQRLRAGRTRRDVARRGDATARRTRRDRPARTPLRGILIF